MSTQAKAAGRTDSLIARWIHRAGFRDEHDFILRVVQPALVGLIDGTVSSLAPIFAAALASSSHTALLVGFSTALGAGVSMGWSEALSDTGEQTGRGSAIVRGAITGGMTTLGGIFHTLPFIISDVNKALVVAGIVVVVFGLPGGANLPTYDAFVDAGIRHILVRHEAGGGHAAEGYAKATGKVGVSFATSGPGATNLMTPITDAMMDSVPVVFITGQVRTELLGTDGFQEADTIGITMPVVKHSFMIQHPQELPRAIHEAFHIARSGRPGPVLVDIPQDLSRAEIDYEPVGDVRLPGYQPRVEGNQKQIRQAAKALAAAQRPVIYAGGGIVNANASEELIEFVTADRFPVTCTLMGLGAFPAPHEQWLGMLGMHGTRAANYAMDEADLIVAIGARFDDRITGKLSEFAPRAKFIHIDVDPAEISKNVPAHIPIVGDAKNVLE